MKLPVAMSCLLSTSIALAEPPSGRYKLERGSKGYATIHSGRGPKRRIPDCTLAESIPIPAFLRITYSRSSPTIDVGSEQWKAGGLTLDENGAPKEDPSRIAYHPNPGPKLEIRLHFRASGSQASGRMLVMEHDDNGQLACAITYGFAGSYSP